MQYREYVRRLERLGQDLANKDLSDIDLQELFLKPEDQNLYQDIEGGYVNNSESCPADKYRKCG